MIDLQNEQQVLDQLEADQIEEEVFDSLMDADKQNYLKNRQYFTVDYMTKWAKVRKEGAEIL